MPSLICHAHKLNLLLNAKIIIWHVSRVIWANNKYFPSRHWEVNQSERVRERESKITKKRSDFIFFFVSRFSSFLHLLPIVVVVVAKKKQKKSSTSSEKMCSMKQQYQLCNVWKYWDALGILKTHTWKNTWTESYHLKKKRKRKETYMKKCCNFVVQVKSN